jgi:hypothetical protein
VSESTATLELRGAPDSPATDLMVREPGGEWVMLIDFARQAGLTPEDLWPAFAPNRPSGAPHGTLTFGDLGKFPFDDRSVGELSAKLRRPLLYGAR